MILKNENLEFQLENADQLQVQNNSLNALASRLQSENNMLRAQITEVIQKDLSTAFPSQSTGATVAGQFGNIQRALYLQNSTNNSAVNIPRPSSSTRSNSVQMDGNNVDASTLGSDKNSSLFSHMLTQIQIAASDISQKYRDVKAENEKLRVRLNQFVEALKEERLYNEELSAEGNEKAGQMSQVIAEKEQQLAESQEYLEELSEELEKVKLEAEEARQRHEADIEELLQEKQDSYDALEREYVMLQTELQEVTVDIDEIQAKLSEKDEKLEQLEIEYMKADESLMAAAEEIENLRSEISILLEKQQSDYEDISDGSNPFYSISKEEARELLFNVLRQVQNSSSELSGGDVPSFVALPESLANILDEYKQLRMLSSQMEESNEQTEELITLLDEKEKLVNKLDEKVESLRKNLKERDEEIEQLKQQQQGNGDDRGKYEQSSDALIATEIEDLRLQLEQLQNEEQILREENDVLHNDLENVLKQKEDFENGNVVSLQEYQQLQQEFEQIVEKFQELEELEELGGGLEKGSSGEEAGGKSEESDARRKMEKLEHEKKELQRKVEELQKVTEKRPSEGEQQSNDEKEGYYDNESSFDSGHAIGAITRSLESLSTEESQKGSTGKGLAFTDNDEGDNKNDTTPTHIHTPNYALIHTPVSPNPVTKHRPQSKSKSLPLTVPSPGLSAQGLKIRKVKRVSSISSIASVGSVASMTSMTSVSSNRSSVKKQQQERGKF